MSEIWDWLDELGLQKYAPAFANAEVDFETLLELTQDDLVELGLPLGPRRKIWTSIQRYLNAEVPNNKDSRNVGLNRPQSTVSVEAERRQLTVMFCDVSGSTSMSEVLDPEELREVMLAYQKVCLDAIQQFGGHLAKYLGDGVLAYFGYPNAHEDDPTRSVRAGLALLTSIEELNIILRREMDLEIGVRIGIHTGLVIAGEMGAGDVRERDAIVGETPNIAARLEGLAESGTMVIGPVTRHLIGDDFNCTYLGERSVKGISRPIPVFTVEKERRAQDPLRQAKSRLKHKMFGRQRELNLLSKLWREVESDRGKLVLVSGEAGVGKSRLSVEFVQQVTTDDVALIYLKGSPLRDNTPLFPLKNCIQSIAGIDPASDVNAQFATLKDWVSKHRLAPSTALPALASLLALDDKKGLDELTGSPQFKKQLIEKSLTQALEASITGTAVLLLVEDTHWIDPTTLDWLNQFVCSNTPLKKFVIATARSHFQNPWVASDFATMIELDRLDEAAAYDVIHSVFKGKALPEKVVEQLLDKADGVPLFVEELSKSVRDSNALVEQETEFILSGNVAINIPSSLQSLLTVRLDQLDLGKGVAQIGSVIDSQFSEAMIRPLSSLNESSLAKAFEQLLSSDLLETDNDAHEPTVLFRHALVRDAAYESLLKSRRKDLHGQIADLIEAQHEDMPQYEPSETTNHRILAGQFSKAIAPSKQAASMALKKGANIEAINLLRQALHCIEQLPTNANLRKQELEIQCMIGPALMATKGWGAPEPHQAFQRARALCEEVGDGQQSFAALWGIWLFHAAGSDLKSGLELVRELFRIAEEEGDQALELQAHHAAWGTRCWFGDMKVAIKHVERGTELYDPERHRDHASRYGGHDPGVCAHVQGALTFWYRGFPDTALNRAMRGLEFARKLNHPPSIGHAQLWLCNLLFQRREKPQLAKAAAQLRDFSTAHALGQYMDQATLFSTWAETSELGVEAALDVYKTGLAKSKMLGQSGVDVFRHYMIAELTLTSGRLEESDEHVEQASKLIVAPEPHVMTADILRLKSAIEVSKPTGDQSVARQHLFEGLSVAKEQNARSFELRICIDLARDFLRQDEAQAASDILCPIHNWFTEGFGTVDWRKASVLRSEIDTILGTV